MFHYVIEPVVGFFKGRHVRGPGALNCKRGVRAGPGGCLDQGFAGSEGSCHGAVKGVAGTGGIHRCRRERPDMTGLSFAEQHGALGAKSNQYVFGAERGDFNCRVPGAFHVLNRDAGELGGLNLFVGKDINLL